ncbi:MAG: carboxypeptidase-like regulatory domain-containing protein, partial [Kangiellaceae bacterium]|nr:carboxypeptidase-like regulatory domain-containing protein [Kangiellaceae bacterium]
MFNDSTIYLGNINGAELKEISVAVVDAQIQSATLELLLADQIQVRSLADPELIASSNAIAISNPSKLQKSGFRSLVSSSTQVQLFAVGPIENGATIDDLGSAALINNELHVNGELAVVSTQDNLLIFDLDIDAGQLVARQIAQFNSNHFNPAQVKGLVFEQNLIEWQIGSSYYNSEIPLANITTQAPQAIGDEFQQVSLTVVGDSEVWDQVTVDLIADSSGLVVPGFTQLINDQLSFQNTATAYQLGETYKVELFNQPNQLIDGGEVNFDLPVSLGTYSLFGMQPFGIERLLPANTISGRATNFVLTGSQLDQVESIEVAGATLPSGDFSVNSSGTELTFNLLVNEPGIYSLVANQPGQSEILTAAILVAQALRIDSVMTDNPAGTNLVSDTRGNKISISGAGFEGVLKVHFFEDSPGFEADESNLQSYEFDAGALTFTSPNTVPGRVYKTIIKRDATNETVEATDRLTSVDDTQPFVEDIQTISRANPLVIVLNEAAQASGFSVIKHFKDYSNTADEDVSSRFELEVVNKSITLRLREGQVFDSNSSYSIQINGIADTANNLVVNRSQFAGGVFTSEFVSNDILSPINLGVVRSSDDVAMTPGMLLTRGRSYEFAVDATDNYDDELSYEIRISVNGGISFGPVQKVNSQAFEIAILEDYSNIVVRLTAYDASGNFKSEDFSASVVDPVINASTVYTTPDKVEEKSHSKIHFDITGDADLVTKVDMIVEGKGFHAAYQLADWNSATATIQYLNPKLTDISPRTDVEVTLKINFGYSGYLEVNDSYLLNEDATPPTISIVSPQDGDRVPLDITTDVIIQSFDKFGIEEVAVAINGGDFVALDQINRYQFTPVSTDPVTLQARATDPNNNTGLSQIITLQPFDATLGEPRVEIVNPADGSTFRESQKVNFEILMANVTDATLYMDVGGSETDPRNPAPLAINRADEDPQRFTVQVEIPATDENVVVIARLESGVLNSKKFINVLRDTGIDENLEVRIEPSETVLTGTGIRITADVPSEMVDYSEDSNVEVRDPEASASGTNYPMQQLDKLVSISNEAGQVLVSSELIDLSNHSKVEESRLNKTQFLGAIRESVIDLSNSASLIGKALVVPGDDDLVVALESVEGYQVQQGSNTILDESGVAIGDIFFNGEYLVVEDNQEGLTRIHLIKKNSNGWDAAITHPVQGKIHAVLGNNLLFTYGNLLSSVQINQGQLVPSVGHLFQEEIHQVQSLGATVLVQTASGINLLSLNNLTNALELDAFYAINSLVGSVLHDRYLTIWTDKQLVQYEVLNNLEIVQTNTVELDSEILEYLVDDELLLFKLANAQLGSYWKLSQDLNTLGYLTDDAKQILVGNGRYYFIRDNSIESQALVTDLTGQSLSLAVNNNIHGWTIGGLKSINGLGQETVVVTDTSSNNVVYTFADKSRDTIFVSRGNFVGGDLNVVVTESNGTQHSVAINLIEANASNLVATSPQNNATITQEALVPVNLEYAQDARIENQQITVDGVEVDLASSVNGAIGWLRADPQATQQSLNISVNSNEVSVNQLDLIEANTELGRVTIIHPQNNQQFIEGEWLDVDYRIVDDTSDEFKYTEVALLDFNQNIISLQLVNAEEGKVSIRLSGLVEQDNYTVRVRGYYGDSYRYSQRTVGIRVIPKNERLNIELSGVPYEVMQGSIMIPVAVVNNLPVTGSITIDVTDENGTPIVSGADSVEFSAPNVTKLMVKATANDGVGNQASTTLESRVISPFALASNANQVDFDVALAGVEQSYFADGSELVDHTGQTLKELNGQVTAMTYVNDRLLVAYSGQGLFFLDHKDDFGFLGRYESQQDYVQLVTFENKLLALTALGELELFSIEGNSLQKIEEYFDSNVVQIGLNSQGWVVLTDDELLQFNWALNSSSKLVTGFGFVSFVMESNFVYLLDEAGTIKVLAESGIQSFDLKLQANTLRWLNGKLIALGSEFTYVIDATSPMALTLVGQFEASNGENLGNSLIVNGAIYLPDATDLAINQGSNQIQEIYASKRARGIHSSTSISRGVAMSAAQHYGAVALQPNERGIISENVVPQPQYTASIGQVAVVGESYYLLNQEFGQIERYTSNNLTQSQVILSGQNFTQFTVTPTRIIAAAGDTLYITDHDGRVKDELVVEQGDDILQLTSADEKVFVATSSGSVLLIEHLSLPIDEYEVAIQNLFNSASGIDALQASIDFLVYSVASDLHRYNLTTNEDVSFAFSNNITALELRQGTIWLVANGQLHSMDLIDWIATTGLYDFSNNIQDIDADFNKLLVAEGSAGSSILELPFNSQAASSSLQLPAAGTIYQHGELIELSIVDAEGVAAVDYYINGKLVSSNAHAPFDSAIMIPAELRNGQAFDVSANIIDKWGRKITSATRRAILQSDDLPVNDFSVTINLETESYLPKPLQISAEIIGSSQPIQQVEFYAAPEADGPYELLRKHYGPIYEVSKNFGVADSGKYIKARAVDVYGNFAESQSVQIVRLTDVRSPTASLAIDGATIATNIVPGGRPFNIVATLIDEHSGVEQALLRRNGTLVSAAFAASELVYQEADPQVGDVYDYLVEVTDRAGLTSTASMQITVSADDLPQIVAVNVPAEILEQSQLDVELTVSDDVALSSIDVEWQGKPNKRQVSGKQYVYNNSIKDLRAERPVSDLVENLNITVTDDRQQSITQSVPVTVKRDLAPDASLMVIEVPEFGIYNDRFSLRLSNLDASDDGVVTKLKTELIDITHSTPSVTPICNGWCYDQFNRSIRLPGEAQPDDKVVYQIRLTDELGQTDTSEPFEINLTQRPNEVFFENNGDDSLNPSIIQSGIGANYMVKVIDSSHRAVPNQTVTFRYQTETQNAFVASVTTDIDGLALLNWSANLPAGQFDLQASVLNWGQVETAVLPVEIAPGLAQVVEVANIQQLKPKDVFEIEMRLLDAAGNLVHSNSEQLIDISIVDPQFHFGFASNAQVSSLYNNEGDVIGETARVTFVNGVANIEVAATSKAGVYPFNFSYPQQTSQLETRYIATPNTASVAQSVVNVEVVAGDAYGFRFREVSKT